MNLFIKTVVALLFLGMTLFAQDIGVVTGLNGSATLSRDGSKIEVSLGMKLQEKDTVVTRGNAKVQIIFEDETIITIGKNSEFSIEEYLFDETDEPSLKFGLLRGAMRTITGKIGKMAPEKFAVKTKTATIGIRGTNFTIVEKENSEAIIYCTYGAISVTIDGYENVVQQGFYAHTLDGVTSVQAFTPSELKAIRKVNFLDKKSKKSEKLEQKNIKSLSKAVKAPQIDTTRDVLPSSGIVSKRVTTEVRDAKQLTKDEHEHDEYYIDYPQNQISDLPITDTTNNSNTDIIPPSTSEQPSSLSDMYGYSSSFDTGTSPDILGSIVSLLTPISGAHSIMGVYVYSSDNEYDWWSFNLQEPTSSVTKDNYITEFTSATVTGSAQNITNVRINSSEFKAIDDDLQSGDALTWGKWTASVVYDDDVLKNQQENLSGLWIAGERSPLDIAATFGSQKISYNGVFKAMESPTDSIIKGSASMDIDFGADTAILNILYGTGRTFNMSILAGGSVAGYQNKISPNSDEYGSSYGLFYGSSGELIGGNFSTTSGGYESLELKGIFELSSEALTTAVLDSNVRSGWLIDYSSQDYANHLQYEITSDKTFNPENSFIVLNELQSSTGESDYWELKVDAQPISYTSNEQFQGRLLSAYMIPGDGGSSKNAQIVDSEFVATGDDLANDDYMSWGYWNAKLSYENTQGTQEHLLSGYWQSGNPTPSSVVDAIVGSDVSYSGIYRAVDFTQQNSIVNGQASLNVDFGADTAVLNINYSKGRVFDMTLDGNTLSGSLQVNEGEAYGTFYGPEASSVGGNFLTKSVNGAQELRGVYQVTQ